MKKKLTVAAPYLLTLLAVWLLWPAAATIEWIKGTAPPEWRVTQAEQWMVRTVCCLAVANAYIIWKRPSRRTLRVLPEFSQAIVILELIVCSFQEDDLLNQRQQ